MIKEHIGWKLKTIFFLVSQCITLFGSTLVQMAIVWYITLETSSGTWVAAFTVCSYLPQFLISFISGVWADRYSCKRLIIVSDSGIAAVTLILIIVMPYISAQPTLLGAILAVSVIRSLGAGVQMPAVSAVIPRIVPEKQLMRYNGINAAMQSAVQFAAPAAAGAVLTFSTLRSTLLIDILTSAAGIGILSCVFIPKGIKRNEKVSVFADMKHGISYVFSEGFFSRLIITYGLFIFFCVPAGFLATLLVSRLYGNTYWYLTAVELTGFAGMTAGGLIIGIWGGFKNRTVTLITGMAIFGVLTIGMGLSRSFIIYLTLMLLYGVALTTVQSTVTTLVQENADSAVQGRIFGLLGTMYSGFLPAGMAIYGPLADALPLQLIMCGSGAALIIIAIALSADRKFRVVTPQ